MLWTFQKTPFFTVVSLGFAFTKLENQNFMKDFISSHLSSELWYYLLCLPFLFLMDTRESAGKCCFHIERFGSK